MATHRLSTVTGLVVGLLVMAATASHAGFYLAGPAKPFAQNDFAKTTVYLAGGATGYGGIIGTEVHQVVHGSWPAGTKAYAVWPIQPDGTPWLYVLTINGREVGLSSLDATAATPWWSYIASSSGKPAITTAFSGWKALVGTYSSPGVDTLDITFHLSMFVPGFTNRNESVPVTYKYPLIEATTASAMNALSLNLAVYGNAERSMAIGPTSSDTGVTGVAMAGPSGLQGGTQGVSDFAIASERFNQFVVGGAFGKNFFGPLYWEQITISVADAREP